MKRIILSLIIIPLMSSVSFAFPSVSTKGTILELLNGKAQKHQLANSVPVSFDDIVCSRSGKACKISMRFMIPQDDFFTLQKGNCLVEPVQTVYDILDDKSGDLTKSFVKAVNGCI